MKSVDDITFNQFCDMFHKELGPLSRTTTIGVFKTFIAMNNIDVKFDELFDTYIEFKYQ
jgi:hypothetical protein